MKMHVVKAELFHVVGQTDRHEASSHLSHIYKRT